MSKDVTEELSTMWSIKVRSTRILKLAFDEPVSKKEAIAHFNAADGYVEDVLDEDILDEVAFDG